MEHRLKGQPSNAKKEDGHKETQVHIRCTTEDKNRWVKQAQADGKKLSAWITDKLG